MSRIVAPFLLLCLLSEAQAATVKSIDGKRLTLKLSPSELQGIEIGDTCAILSQQGEALATVTVEKVVKGKGIVAKVIERSPLLEVEDSVTIKASDAEDDEDSAETEPSQPANAAASRRPWDVRFAFGSRHYSGHLLQKSKMESNALRIAYHLPDSPFALGIQAITDISRVEDDYEESISGMGLSLEADHYFTRRLRTYVVLDLTSGTYNFEDKTHETTISAEQINPSVALGVSFHWTCFYLGAQYSAASYHRILMGTTTYELNSSGGSLIFGFTF